MEGLDYNPNLEASGLEFLTRVALLCNSAFDSSDTRWFGVTTNKHVYELFRVFYQFLSSMIALRQLEAIPNEEFILIFFHRHDVVSWPSDNGSNFRLFYPSTHLTVFYFLSFFLHAQKKKRRDRQGYPKSVLQIGKLALRSPSPLPFYLSKPKTFDERDEDPIRHRFMNQNWQTMEMSN